METKFTEQESLAVINEMINRARNNIQMGSANTIIYNGYAVAVVAILNFILLHVLPKDYINWSYSVWWLMAPSFFMKKPYMKKSSKHSVIVRTQIDGIISALWKGFSISVAVLLIILFSLAFGFQAWYYLTIITPLIMIMVGLAEFGMAKACRFKPFFWGAVNFWAGALICLLTYFAFGGGDAQLLVLAVCMIIGFVIPGYQLNKLAKENV
jgi:hypothetical protein